MVSAHVVTILFPEAGISHSSFTTLESSGHIIGLGKALIWDSGHWDTDVFDIGSAGLTSSFTTLAHSAGFKELGFTTIAFSARFAATASFSTIANSAAVKELSFTNLAYAGILNTARGSFTILQTSGNVVFFQAASSFTSVEFSVGLTIPPVPRDFAEEKAKEIFSREIARRRRGLEKYTR